jgi:hypothetical protein
MTGKRQLAYRPIDLSMNQTPVQHVVFIVVPLSLWCSRIGPWKCQKNLNITSHTVGRNLKLFLIADIMFFYSTFLTFDIRPIVVESHFVISDYATEKVVVFLTKGSYRCPNTHLLFSELFGNPLVCTVWKWSLLWMNNLQVLHHFISNHCPATENYHHTNLLKVTLSWCGRMPWLFCVSGTCLAIFKHFSLLICGLLWQNTGTIPYR